MIYGDKIVDNSVSDSLDGLKKNGTLLRMKLMGRDYEQLTVIHAIRSRNGVKYFLIENPAEFQDILLEYKELPFQFEFNGPDGLPYSFQTLGDWVEDAEIWLRFPAFIERRQQRRNFRIKAPEDTKIYFTGDGKPQRIDVINLSQAGTLGALATKHKNNDADPVLNSGDIINNARLVFKTNSIIGQIEIKKALIVRTETDSLTGNLCFGIQFSEMAREDEKKLTEIIFELQRQFLRKRLPDI